METSDTPLIFPDRHAAGRTLAQRLMKYCNDNPLILALPRGGVAVGYEIACALRAPLHVLVARKLGAPDNPELGISPEQITEIVAEETAEMKRRLRRYRGERPLPSAWNRTVILADDRLATGMTALAAIESLRQQRPRRLVLAVPVCAPETARALSPEVDELLCGITSENFGAVGCWYKDFRQLSDEKVVTLLERARQWRPPGAEPALEADT